MNALLIYPEFPETYWSFKHALKFPPSSPHGSDSCVPPNGSERNNNIVHQLDFDPNPVREHTSAMPTFDCRGGRSLLPAASSLTAPSALARARSAIAIYRMTSVRDADFSARWNVRLCRDSKSETRNHRTQGSTDCSITAAAVGAPTNLFATEVCPFAHLSVVPLSPVHSVITPCATSFCESSRR